MDSQLLLVGQRLIHSCAGFPPSTVPWREIIRLGGKIRLGLKHVPLTGFPNHVSKRFYVKTSRSILMTCFQHLSLMCNVYKVHVK